MRVCLVYDHVYPHTIGGAERWLRDLALRLADLGHDVTYLTMQHWDEREPPQLGAVEVIGLVPPGRVYGDGRRSLGPPLRFGVAVGRHLLRYGRAYDVVHTPAFPYFPLLAAGMARRRGGYRIVVDWLEVWTRAYWHRYAGVVRGTIGWLVQRACIRVPQRALCLARLHAERLVAEGYRGTPTLLPGIYAGSGELAAGAEVDGSLVVYAGRHVQEKRIDALVRAVAHARSQRPSVRLELFGNGPETPRLEALVDELGLREIVHFAGHRPEEEVDAALGRAACLATASEREGYGLVVVEAAAHGTPSVVVAGPENAAVELVDDGVNGRVASSADADDLAAAILGVLDAGAELRTSTARWFEDNADRLRLDRSVELVVAHYGEAKAEDALQPHGV